MKRATYTLRREPTKSQFRAFLAESLKTCDSLGLMMQPRKNFGNRALEVLDRLAPFLRRSAEVTKWPGSQSLPGRGSTLYEYDLRPEVIEIIEQTSLQLYSWMNPDLPEDLHLLRADGTTWLGSTANEADAWLELTPSEFDELLVSHPNLASVLARDPD